MPERDAYVFGMNRGWKEMHLGADLQVPGIYKPVMKWITPLFLAILLVWWSVEEAVPALLMQNVADASTIPYRWFSRAVMLVMFGLGLLLIRKAWERREAG